MEYIARGYHIFCPRQLAPLFIPHIELLTFTPASFTHYSFIRFESNSNSNLNFALKSYCILSHLSQFHISYDFTSAKSVGIESVHHRANSSPTHSSPFFHLQRRIDQYLFITNRIIYIPLHCARYPNKHETKRHPWMNRHMSSKTQKIV